MQTKNYFQTMKDGTQIRVNNWLPDPEEKIKGILILHHGLAEHSMRYDRFGSVLSENGYVLISYDLRGHGASAEQAELTKTGRFGQLALKDGFNKAVEDLYEIVISARAKYPETKIFLMGHSFGSFVSQRFIQKYGHSVEACLLCGTSYMSQGFTHMGHAIASIVRFFKGRNAYSNLLSTLSFSGYNKRVENPQSPNSWVSKSSFNVEMYDSDKWCGFPLTTSFYCDLLYGLNQIGKNKNIKKIRKDLPLFFIWGSEDPVGGYGKNIEKLIAIYKKMGIKDIKTKVYQGDRHELLNEDDKETVEADILAWLDNLTK